MSSFKSGVITGKAVQELLLWAKSNNFALPAVNCTSSTTVNAALEAAKKVNSPVIIQFSQGGAQFFAGKSIKDKFAASIAGAVAGAHYVRAVAPLYGVTVILHSDHCAKKLLPWFDGMLEADEKYFAEHGEPLFSSHMLDLSEESLEYNIQTCVKYLKRMAKINCLLEMELGITGGEEDGVDNSDVDNASLYSQPDEIFQTYQALTAVAPNMFTIAASFGNVHGVYKPGNVSLQPSILGNAQKYAAERLGGSDKKPLFFVFHGGSGSEKKDIQEALGYGVIKFNIDTDTQWAYWNGVRQHYLKYEGYLQGQIGNPEGPDKPNKKKYDPRVWLRAAEQSFVVRLSEAFADLNATNVFARL